MRIRDSFQSPKKERSEMRNRNYVEKIVGCF